MMEINIIGIEMHRWDRLWELIGIRKTKPFVVLFGSEACAICQHIRQNVLP